MIVADKLGVGPDDVEVLHSDTGDRAARPRHLRLALAGRRRHRASRWPRDKVHRQGPHDRRPPARGAPRTTSSSSAARSGEGHARQGDAARPRSRSRRSPPTTCPTASSPTSRRRSPTTRPTSRSRSARTSCVVEIDEETGKVDAAAVRRGRRLRQPDQPADRRGPGARRHHPGCRAGALRGGGLRRRRQPAHLDARRLPGAGGGRVAVARPSTTPSRRARRTRSGSRASARPARSAATPAVINAVVDALSPPRRHRRRHARVARDGSGPPSKPPSPLQSPEVRQ